MGYSWTSVVLIAPREAAGSCRARRGHNHMTETQRTRDADRSGGDSEAWTLEAGTRERCLLELWATRKPLVPEHLDETDPRVGNTIAESFCLGGTPPPQTMTKEKRALRARLALPRIRPGTRERRRM